MDDITLIRQWLMRNRGHWTQIAERTGLSTKTIQRFAKTDDWNFTYATYLALHGEMGRSVVVRGVGS